MAWSVRSVSESRRPAGRMSPMALSGFELHTLHRLHNRQVYLFPFGKKRTSIKLERSIIYAVYRYGTPLIFAYPRIEGKLWWQL